MPIVARLEELLIDGRGAPAGDEDACGGVSLEVVEVDGDELVVVAYEELRALRLVDVEHILLGR